MAKTFYGGISMRKVMPGIPRKLKIKRVDLPDTLRLPLSQKGYRECDTLVSPGEKVAKGQLIASSVSALSKAEDDLENDIRLFSPASATVEKIGVCNLPDGSVSRCIVLRCDSENRIDESVKPEKRPISKLSPKEILKKIKGAGIQMNDKSGFPSFSKLFPEHGKPLVTKLIIDCTESEPYVSSNHAAIIAEPSYVIGGAKILLKMLNLRSAILAATSEFSDYYDIYSQLKSMPEAKSPLISFIKPSEKNLFSVVKLKAKYPSGSESLILNSILEREFPTDTPAIKSGYMIVSAGTCRAIYSTFITGMPYTERIVTVNGNCVKKPANLILPLGISAADAIDFCSGLSKAPEKVVFSGMLSGFASDDTKTPITGSTSSILLFSKSVLGKTRLPVSIKYEAPPTCIGCGRCITVCPMHLMPLYIAEYSHLRKYAKCKTFSVDTCTECGCCEFVCPGRLPLLKYIRSAKCFSSELEPEKEKTLDIFTEMFDRVKLYHIGGPEHPKKKAVSAAGNKESSAGNKASYPGNKAHASMTREGGKPNGKRK